MAPLAGYAVHKRTNSEDGGSGRTKKKPRVNGKGSPKVPPKLPGGPTSEKALEKPKRALSAYNIFLREERRKILATSKSGGGKGSDISFEDMGRLIGKRWKEVKANPGMLSKYKKLAEEDTKRYVAEMEVYNEKKKEIILSRVASSTSGPSNSGGGGPPPEGCLPPGGNRPGGGKQGLDPSPSNGANEASPHLGQLGRSALDQLQRDVSGGAASGLRATLDRSGDAGDVGAGGFGGGQFRMPGMPGFEDLGAGAPGNHFADAHSALLAGRGGMHPDLQAAGLGGHAGSMGLQEQLLRGQGNPYGGLSGGDPQAYLMQQRALQDDAAVMQQLQLQMLANQQAQLAARSRLSEGYGLYGGLGGAGGSVGMGAGAFGQYGLGSSAVDSAYAANLAGAADSAAFR